MVLLLLLPVVGRLGMRLVNSSSSSSSMDYTRGTAAMVRIWQTCSFSSSSSSS
jgi:hypothetical protein